MRRSWFAWWLVLAVGAFTHPAIGSDLPAPASQACASLESALPQGPEGFSPPITITRGGTYSGKWFSSRADQPAIRIQTAEPVTIENSVVMGGSDLIVGSPEMLVIRNTLGVGHGPKPGKFLNIITGKGAVTIEKNSIYNLWGMRISGRSPGQLAGSVRVVGNLGCNINEGLESRAHFLQLQSGIFIDTRIVDNVVWNEFGKSSVEDVISLYNARGLPSSRIIVEGNFIDGAYPRSVADGYSGGGIILDGGFRDTRPVDHYSGNVDIRRNCIVATTNYGIAIASGSNATVSENMLVASGEVNSEPLKAQNVGVYIWNIDAADKSVFFNNTAISNFIYWRKALDKMRGTGKLNNYWTPDCEQSGARSLCVRNGSGGVRLDTTFALGLEQASRLATSNCFSLLQEKAFSGPGAPSLKN